MFLRSSVKLHNSISVRNFAPKFRRRQKKRSLHSGARYPSPEFRISCCQVGITYQKTMGAKHISHPSVLDVRGWCPPAPPKSTPMNGQVWTVVAVSVRPIVLVNV